MTSEDRKESIDYSPIHYELVERGCWPGITEAMAIRLACLTNF